MSIISLNYEVRNLLQEALMAYKERTKAEQAKADALSAIAATLEKQRRYGR